MKIRNGFVSNSSSTSFVIAFKNEEPKKCPTCGRTDPYTNNIIYEIENSCNTDTMVEHYTTDEIISDLENNIENNKEYLGKYPESDYLRDDINEMEQLITKIEEKESEGYEVMRVSISNHSNILNTLNNSINSGAIIVLDREDG